MCKYEDKVAPKLEKIEQWREQGYNLEQISIKLDITRQSLNAYAKKHPELQAALEKSKEELVARIEFKGLYRRALGYAYNEKKVVSEKILDAEGNDTGYKKVKTEITEKQVPPDTTACIFALKNLAPDRFKDRQEVAHGMAQDSFDDMIKAFEKIADTAEKEALKDDTQM